MSNVIALTSCAPSRARPTKVGFLHAIVAAFRRGHDTEELRGQTDRLLQDIGLTRSDVATIDWPSRRDSLMRPGEQP
jgi:uncharacterized protein YjiS (DUF1127 family)